MNRRIASIDALRGITIIMMILCSSIGWNSGLPAWMFHCQCPPPTYAFDPMVKGITWVDLVFPWFLFSMGAAIPFALGSRIRKGWGMGRISAGLVRRWLTLAAFGLVLGNAGLVTDYCAWGPSLLRLGIWCGLFLALWRAPAKHGYAVNLAGLAVVIALLIVEHSVFGASMSLHSNDIIIMVLSLVALTGGFAWLLTRERPGWRIALLLLVAALKEVSWQWHPFGFMQFPGWIDWLLNWRYLQYLVVVLLGTVVGDLLSAASAGGPQALCASPLDRRAIIAAGLCFLMTPLALWGFFARQIWMLFTLVFALGGLAMWLTRGDKSVWAYIMRIGFACLQFGIIFDPIDGGITKDHCNLSYMLSTGGLACLMTSFLLWCEAGAALRGRTLSKTLTMTGQNPMIAYTVAWFVIMPALMLVRFDLFEEMTVGRPLMGLLQGVIITGLMVCATCLLTRAKIFWRS
ncbi:MAG: DUF5009 domain-containing protein [Bacteroidales bacterium]|nr:DUF5009 domain-containing protein [Bacteroidales bacterium]